METKTTEKELKEYKAKFPLQTFNSMADRWDKTRQHVRYLWETDPAFPKEETDLIEQTENKPLRVFSYDDVKKYEKIRGYGK